MLTKSFTISILTRFFFFLLLPTLSIKSTISTRLCYLRQSLITFIIFFFLNFLFSFSSLLVSSLKIKSFDLTEETLFFYNYYSWIIFLGIFLQLDYSLQQGNESVFSKLKRIFQAKNCFIKLILSLTVRFIISHTLSVNLHSETVSHRRCSVKRGFLRNFANFIGKENICVGVSF